MAEFGVDARVLRASPARASKPRRTREIESVSGSANVTSAFSLANREQG